MSPSDIIYVGTGTHVCALNRAQGKTIWRKKLPTGVALSGDAFVTLLVDSGHVYAHTRGELYCLNAATGALVWRNGLDGLGYGLASLAIAGTAASPGAAATRRAQDQVAAMTIAAAAPK